MTRGNTWEIKFPDVKKVRILPGTIYNNKACYPNVGMEEREYGGFNWCHTATYF